MASFTRPDGVTPNPSESIKCINETIRWYSNPVAMFNLAHIYFYEEAGMSDLNEAFKLLVKSASQNVIYSFELLCLVIIKKYKSLNVQLSRFEEDSLLIEKVIKNIKMMKLKEPSFYNRLYDELKEINLVYYGDKIKNQIRKRKVNINNIFYEGFNA